MRFVVKAVVIGQLLHLARRCAHQAVLAEADGDAPKAREAFDILLALVVIDIDALAALDDRRADLLMATGIGRRVEIIGDVAGGGGIRLVIHDGNLGHAAFGHEMPQGMKVL